MSNENHAETISRLTLETLPENQMIKLEDGRMFAFVSRGDGCYEMSDVTQPHTLAAPLPSYVRQHVTLQDEGSLVKYANKFKNADTLLFADIATSTIRAVIDYHNLPTANRPGEVPEGAVKGGVPGDDKASAQLLAHTASLVIPYSEEWKTWLAVDGKMMRQLDFVRFLEENALDVADPDAASLIEVCRDLQALRKVNFTSVVRTESNNAERLEFVDETKAGAKGGVEIPHTFMLYLPVYFNGESYSLAAKLRWQVDDGHLALGIKLIRAERLRQNVFKDIVGAIGDATELDVLYGKAA